MHAQSQAERRPATTLSRRHLLAAGGALVIGCAIRTGIAAAGEPKRFAPNAFVRIDGEGLVTLVMPYVEMGQGTYTAIPMLLAEELDVRLDQVRLEHAPPDEALYRNPLLGVQATGNSNAIRGAWMPLRQAGAAARKMLVSAAARQWKVDEASCRTRDATVIHEPSGRSLGYGDLAGAAALLPVPQAVELKAPGEFRLIGRPAKRLDAAEKVDGRAVYGIDARPAGVRIATLAQSPVFGGRLRSVDASRTMAVRGVRQIVQLDDAVAVVADHMGAALKGLAALHVLWDDGAFARLGTADVAGELEAATRSPGALAQAEGDAVAALNGAATRIDAVYECPFLAHAALEPMNCTVHVRDDGCEIWVGSQAVARARRMAAQELGLPEDRVTVHNHLLGGGFGRRLEADGVVRAVQIARQVSGPVKVIWTREEDIQHDMYRPYWVDRISAGLDQDGRLVAWFNRFAGSSVVARYLPAAFTNGTDPDSVEGAVDLPYDIPNFRVEFCRVEPPAVPTAFWRSVGPSHNVFVTESFVDELAAAAGKDPVAFRRSLLARAPRARAVLDLAAEKAGWGSPLPAGRGRGVSLQSVFGSYVAQVAEVEVAKDGTVAVRKVVCAVDCGVAVNPDTVRAQIQGGIIFGATAALYGEITVKDGRVEQSNFDTYPIMRINEAPAIEVHLVPSAEAPGGIGENGTSAIIPAVANAVFAATGKRLRRMPVDPALLKRP